MPKTLKPNQQEAMEEILSVYRRGDGVNYVLLRAQMQSGKTGTFQGVARQMLLSGMVERVIIISGSGEVELYMQAINDTVEYNGDLVTHDKVTNHTLYNADLQAKIKIIFRSCGKKTFRNTRMDIRRALIIVEESHLDQNKGQQLDTFLKSHGLSLNGTTAEMMENNTYILSVSATPFSEASGISHNKSSGKEIVDLAPGDGYRGVGDYVRRERIHETYPIRNNMERFIAEVTRRGKKYNLVRARSKPTAESLAPSLAAAGIKVLYFTQDRKDISISDLDDIRPTQPTVIFLVGLLRCGKVVPKKNIGFVWECSIGAKTDTILQSLLGRMCGYYKPTDAWVDIFVPAIVLKADKATGFTELGRYVQGMEEAVEMIPKHATNVVAPRDIALHERMPVAPIRLGPFTPAQLRVFGLPTGSGSGSSGTDSAYNLIGDERFKKLIRTAIANGQVPLTTEQKAEIEEIMSTHDMRTGFRKWSDGVKDTSKNHFHSAVKANLAGEACAERISGDEPVGIATVTASTEYPDTVGCVFVLFQLKAGADEAPKSQRIPGTTGKEIFAIVREEGAPPPLPAGTPVVITRLSPKIFTDPGTFFLQLNRMVALWNKSKKYPSLPEINNRLEAAGGGALSFSREAFGVTCATIYEVSETQNHFKAKLERISEKHNVRFALTPDSVSATHFSFTSISWE
jgi:hypothetical protein